VKSICDRSKAPDVHACRSCWLAAALVCAVGLLFDLTPTRAAEIAVSQAWSRATPKGATVAAGYLTIENHGDSADSLLSASTPVAGRVEIHEMIEAGGIMRMRPAKDGLAIPPNGRAVLAPGSSHLMFLDLLAPFSEGDRVPVSLDFEKAGKIDVTLDVGSIGAKGPQLGGRSEGAVHAAPRASEPFFTHICATRVMANVTVSPGRSGPVEITVQLEDTSEKPMVAEALSVTLSDPDGRIAPIAASAERVAVDTWRAWMSVSEAGKWDLALGITATSKETIDIAASILLE
jgi:copper(I)-binding protein